jgi:tripartite-type tricarboxylate transporter receptor subunit TctC
MRVGPLAFMTVAALALAPAAQAQKVDFSGQKITLAVGSTAGGAYDLYGRLVARHLGNHLPGNPIVVPQNMPGAGHLRMTNWLYNVAPKDGTALAIVQNTAPYENLMGNTNARFDARRFNWLASLNGYTGMAMVWHTTPFMSAQDLIDRPSLLGASGATSDVTVWPHLLNELIGTKTKTVKGYPGTAGIALALERGEVQGSIGEDWDGLKVSKGRWVSEKLIRVLLQLTLTKHPDLQDVPLVLDFAKTPESRATLEFFVARQQYGRPFIAPPGTPAPIVAAYRDAFLKLVNDPAFRQEAAQQQATVDLATGETVAAFVDRLHATPKPVLDRAIALTKSVGE